MKSTLAWIACSLGLALVAVNAPLAQASSEDFLGQALVREAVNSVSALELINWKVGDSANYDVSLMFGKAGTMTKAVTKDEGTALWVAEDAALMGQQEKIEILLNKADGKILKMIHNGKEEQVPNDKVEIISQDYTEITVPAGHFKAIHVVAKTEKVSKLEVWANPRDTVMEGALKQVVATGMMGDMTMELTSFKRMP